MRDLPQNVFHLVDGRNWPGVQRDGLLCAADLLRREGMSDPRHVRAHRPQETQLRDGVVLRDQAPMPPAALARGLDPGLEPADWYALINGCVFFWLDESRLGRHLGAQAGRPQVLLTLDGPRLASAYSGQACVTPFNLGAALRKPAQRGPRSFVPLHRWRDDGWMHEARPGQLRRAPSHRPAEFVIRASVPDAMDYVVDARPCGS